MLELILAGLTVAGAILAAYVSYRVTDAINKNRWVEMDSTCKKYDKFHEEHFTHALNHDIHESAMDRVRIAERLDVLTAGKAALVSRELEAHGRLDDSRFDNLTESMREVKADLKAILQELRK